ncbi:MAG: CinA family protein [Nitrospirota bacterium]
MDNEFYKIVKKISEILLENNLRLSIAESCTGGFISHVITNLPGASKFFEMSVVSYSENSKKSVLGIKGSLLKKHGVISEDTAIAMAKSVRKTGNTDYALSVTGIAGPEKMEGKDVGLIYIAVAKEDLVESKGIKLKGRREEIKEQASLEALQFLYQVLKIWA